MTEPQSSMININAKVTAVHLASTLVGSCLKHRFSIVVIATVIPRLISSPTAWKAKMVTGIPITAKTMHRAWPVLVEGEIAPYPKTEIQFVTGCNLISIKRTAVVTTDILDCSSPNPSQQKPTYQNSSLSLIVNPGQAYPQDAINEFIIPVWFYLHCDLSYIASILFPNVNFTH